MQQTKYLTGQNKPMPEIGFVKLLGALGIPLFFFGWISDPDSLKSWISYIAGGIMSCVWFAFKIDRWRHEAWMRKEERRRLRDKE
jgi:hypothetical protein